MKHGSSKFEFLLRRVRNQLWVRAALYGIGGIATALIAAVAGHYLSFGKAEWLGANAVKDLLTILASSMLAVATFSLSTMVAAFTAAASSATPRASTLLTEDKTAQTALATFVGAFLFSIVGLIALSTGIYGPEGRVVMFGVTVVVIGLVVITLLRWIGQLARFGRVGETISRVETVTMAALREQHVTLISRANDRSGAEESGRPLLAGRTAYVQHVDTGRLQDLAEEKDLHICVRLAAGAFTDPLRPLAFIDGDFDEATERQLRAAFTLGESRTYEQDPRFGLIVLSEIASRALSPAVNDPGTAIFVINALARLLQELIVVRAEAPAAEESDRTHARVSLPGVLVDDLFIDAFRPISRDGAGTIEVGLRLLRVLSALAASKDETIAAAAAYNARLAMERFHEGLAFDGDRQAMHEAYETLIPARFRLTH